MVVVHLRRCACVRVRRACVRACVPCVCTSSIAHAARVLASASQLRDVRTQPAPIMHMIRGAFAFLTRPADISQLAARATAAATAADAAHCTHYFIERWSLNAAERVSLAWPDATHSTSPPLCPFAVRSYPITRLPFLIISLAGVRPARLGPVDILHGAREFIRSSWRARARVRGMVACALSRRVGRMARVCKPHMRAYGDISLE